MAEATDPKLQEKKVDKRKRDAISTEITTRLLMAQPETRRWVWNQILAARIFESTISFDVSGYAISAFREGRRSVGLQLLAEVTKFCPKEYLLMTQENSDDRTDRKRSNQLRDGGAGSDPELDFGPDEPDLEPDQE